MSNHFPTLPGSWLLASVTYTATFTSGDYGDGALGSITGVNGGAANFWLDGFLCPPSNANEGSAPEVAILVGTFNFDTPGSAGSFDQDTVEGTIKTVLDNVAAALQAINGDDTLAEAKAQIQVTRAWGWQDSTGNYSIAHTDTMTYPS